MTLEKCIQEINELEVPFYQEPCKKEILHVVEDVRQELRRTNKALELMSIHLQRFQDCRCFQRQTWKEYFLKEASETDE